MSDNQTLLSNTEIDAIGEVLNISMGSAATAISTMLDRQVVITTPKVAVQSIDDISYAELEPAMLVRIEYVEGISGSNVMVFRQDDMQVILNLLMGNEGPPTEEFVFDELSMSAACEVMNQMMGASATALSEFLGKPINISTPTAVMLTSPDVFKDAIGVDAGSPIVSIAFNLNIEGVMNSDFISVMHTELAKMIVEKLLGDQQAMMEEAPPPEAPAAEAAMPEISMDDVMAELSATAPMPDSAMPPPAPVQPAPAAPPAQAPAEQQMPPMQQMPPQPPMQQQMPQMQQAPPQQMPQMQPPMQQQMPYPQQPYPPYPGYPYPPYPGAMPPAAQPPQQVNVQTPQFPSFVGQRPPEPASPLTRSNMDLVLNVAVDVSVEIGTARRKIKDIVDFTQGTVIELEKQAGAPVDIVVNGQLIARGDVVVIEDNFGVRITEIVGAKELLESLEKAN